MLGLKYPHITLGGLLADSTVEIISNVLNAVSLAILLFAWSRGEKQK